ncbi:hypothetical protein ABH981_005658 [Bradyrhizobium ottawaense]
MVLKVVTPVAARLSKQRIGAEPLAQGQIGFLISGQAAMCAIMHQDREAQLARADDCDGEGIGDRIGPPRDQGDRANDQRPGVRDQRNTFPGHTLSHVGKLVVGQEIAGTHAKRGHGLAFLVRIA